MSSQAIYSCSTAWRWHGSSCPPPLHSTQIHGMQMPNHNSFNLIYKLEMFIINGLLVLFIFIFTLQCYCIIFGLMEAMDGLAGAIESIETIVTIRVMALTVVRSGHTHTHTPKEKNANFLTGTEWLYFSCLSNSMMMMMPEKKEEVFYLFGIRLVERDKWLESERRGAGGGRGLIKLLQKWVKCNYRIWKHNFLVLIH